MLNLDTHILVDFLRGNLKEKEKEIVFNDEIGVSDIVLWELAKLVQLKRLVLDLGDSRIHRFFGMIQIFPITLEIARKSCELDIRADPADEIIAATSVIHQIPLITRDRKIRRSKIVPLA